jgi:hypothetical protein
MSVLPLSVILRAASATNPALPDEDCVGTLSFENGNLVFKSGSYVYRIPAEHIDGAAYYGDPEFMGDTWRFWVTFLLSLGFVFIPLPFCIWILYFEFTAIDAQIVIEAWDETYGVNATTIFSIGKRRADRDLARAVIKEIWALRGQYRDARIGRSAPVVRG